MLFLLFFNPTKQAVRLVLPDTEEMADEDLGVLFMKIDANGSGGVDWDEFTGFLLQARNEERKKKNAAGDWRNSRGAGFHWLINRSGVTVTNNRTSIP